MLSSSTFFHSITLGRVKSINKVKRESKKRIVAFRKRGILAKFIRKM